jgi:hypothetical protein
MEALEEKCKKVVNLAYIFLGNPMQIVVNESNFSRNPSAGSLWTDHGIEHSIRILEIVSELIKKNKLKQPLTEKEMFYLFCAIWLHDIGMYTKDTDINNPTDHRKYHGIISGRVVRKMYEVYGKNSTKNPWDSHDNIDIVVVLCDAHQLKVPLDGIKLMKDPDGRPIRTAILASFLALGDALDITRERAPSVFYKFFSTYFYTPSEASQFEWIVNQCISRCDNLQRISVPPELKEKYIIQLTTYPANESYEIVDRPPTIRTGLKKLRGYIQEYIHFYIGEHLEEIKTVYEDFERRTIEPPSIKVRRPDACKPYKEMRPVMPDYFERQRIPEIVGNKVESIRKDLKKPKKMIDDFYIFILDKLTWCLTYWNAPNIGDFSKLSVENARDWFRATKVPVKCGIVGHVAYLCMPQLVKDIYWDPRTVFGSVDRRLNLRSVILLPIVHDKRDLISVFLFNRGKDSLRWTAKEFGLIHDAIYKDADFINGYADKFNRIAEGRIEQ